MCVCVCVRACMTVHICACVCMRACMCVHDCAHMCVCVWRGDGGEGVDSGWEGGIADVRELCCTGR